MKKLSINKKRLRVLEPSTDTFASLARSIIYQQLSSKAAGTILKRFIELWPRKAFPKPQDVIAVSEEKMRAAGLSRGKTAYLKDLAAKFIDGTIQPKKFATMSDEEIIEHLVAVKGIGTWTAHMFLIFALNRPNVLPVGDLAIRKGFQKAFGLRSVPTEKKMRELARAHEGEHSYLALHLWDMMDEAKEKKAKKKQ